MAQDTKRGTLTYKDGKHKKYEATVENRVLYCTTHHGKVEIAVLLDACDVIPDEDCGFTIMAAKGAKERKNKVRRSVLGKLSQSNSFIGHHFIALTKEERDHWVEVINVASKIHKTSACKVSGQLTVEVVEGKDLAPKDFHLLSANTSDPYAVLRINSQQNKTKTIYKTLNPTWKEEFSFDISRNEAILFVTLYDEDMITRSDSMGQVVFPLSSLTPSHTHDVWLPVLPKKPYEKISGQIRLKLTYEFTKEEAAKPMGPIFGVNLLEISNNPALCTDGIPKFFSEILSYLEKHAMNEPGIFRVSGSLVHVKALKQSIDEGKVVDYSSCVDIHCVAGVLKLYLRELPVPVLTYAKKIPLIPIENYNKLISVTTLGDKERMHELKMLLTVIPPAHVDLLKALLPSLKRFSDNSKVNMMTTSNLAIVFGPSICRPQVDTFETVLHTVNITSLTSILIDHHDVLFN